MKSWIDVGVVIKHPFYSNLLGTITKLTGHVPGQDEEEIQVSWHNGTESDLYACLAEPADPAEIVNPQNLEIGDEVCLASESPIVNIGKITGFCGECSSKNHLCFL